MIKISDNVFKLNADSNVFLLLNEKVIIDSGRASNKVALKNGISKIISPDDIKFVIFTHLHYDHISNFDVFLNAQFFASDAEISDYKKNPFNSILNDEIVSKFENVNLISISKFPNVFKDMIVINTPGHTRGSICLFYNHKVLFSGDTIFNNGYGRIDLPTAAPELMDDSLDKISKLGFKVLCPGHDY